MGKLYLGGLPTEPDVRRLREELALREGDEVTHEQIEAILNLPRTSDRYRTITNVWRVRMLKDENMEIAAVPGVGFRCLVPAERVDENVKRFQRGTRQQGRSLNRMRRIHPDTLDHVSKTKLDHAARLGAAVFQAGHQ
jgi:hypothetical protein